LYRKAEAAGLTNITCVNLDWNKVTIGEKVQPHDIVLMSRSIPTRLSNTLRKLYLATKTAGYITWRAERTDDLEIELARAIGKSYRLFPDHSLIYRMLRYMGIRAEIETFEADNREKYASLQEAALSLARGTELDEAQFARVLAIAGNYLTEKDGSYYTTTRRMKWVLISWKM
jgi:hypothetical protein